MIYEKANDVPRGKKGERKRLPDAVPVECLVKFHAVARTVPSGFIVCVNERV